MHPAIQKIYVQNRGGHRAVYYLAMPEKTDSGETVYWWLTSRGQEVESDSPLDSPWYTTDLASAEKKALELYGEGIGRKILRFLHSFTGKLLGT